MRSRLHLLKFQTEMLIQRFLHRCHTPLPSFHYRRFLHNRDMLVAISARLRNMPKNFKNESSSLLKVWAHHCECVLAQQVRRSQRMTELYMRIWEEQALRQFIRNLRNHFTRRGKEFMLGAVGATAFNWDANRISEEEMRGHVDEMEYIQMLKQKTVGCIHCTGDKKLQQICECDTDIRTFDKWSVFIEQDDIIVWRRPHPSGSWEYKVYGNYNDVTAKDFLCVQLDTRYRKKWDPTAVQLEVIEKDEMAGTNSDLVYWEMQWPRLFANRDYVFTRRYSVDEERKTAMMLSRSAQHASCPEKKNKYRVADYWSSMVVKPYAKLDEPGIEFSLTYFDNPGVNIPASVTAWVAYRAMPDFLTRLRAATLKYKNYCLDHQCFSLHLHDGSVSTLGDRRPAWLKKLTTEDESDQQDVENFFTTLNNELDEEGIDYEHLKVIINGSKAADEAAKENIEIPSAKPGELEEQVEDATKSSRDVSPVKAVSPSAVPQPVETSCGVLQVGNVRQQGAGEGSVQSAIESQQQDQGYWKYLQPTYYIS